MNRKFALLLITSLVLSLMTASLVGAAAPTAAMTICVNVQGNRTNGPSSPTDEPNITYTITNTASAAATSGSDSEAEILTSPQACFETDAVVEGEYDIEVTSDDTLVGRASGVDLEFGINNLSGITLVEGDLDSNGQISSVDAGILVGQLGGSGLADLDENGSVSSVDAGILVGNLGMTGARSLQPVARFGGSDSADVTLTPASLSGTPAGTVFSVEVDLSNITAPDFNNVQLEISYDTNFVTLFTSTFNIPGVGDITVPAVRTSGGCSPTCYPTNATIQSNRIDNTAGSALIISTGNTWTSGVDEDPAKVAILQFEAVRQINSASRADIVTVVPNADPNGGDQSVGSFISNAAGTAFTLNIINDATSVGMSSADAQLGSANFVIVMSLVGVAALTTARLVVKRD